MKKETHFNLRSFTSFALVISTIIVMVRFYSLCGTSRQDCQLGNLETYAFHKSRMVGPSYNLFLSILYPGYCTSVFCKLEDFFNIL